MFNMQRGLSIFVGITFTFATGWVGLIVMPHLQLGELTAQTEEGSAEVANAIKLLRFFGVESDTMSLDKFLSCLSGFSGGNRASGPAACLSRRPFHRLRYLREAGASAVVLHASDRSSLGDSGRSNRCRDGRPSAAPKRQRERRDGFWLGKANVRDGHHRLNASIALRRLGKRTEHRHRTLLRD